MDEKKLKRAEKAFLKSYPGGFAHPDFAEMIEKKHKWTKTTAFAKEVLHKDAFRNSKQLCEDFSKLVSRSSMVSMFEKPKFRDYQRSLEAKQRKQLTAALEDLIHGKQKDGFESLIDQLSEHKLAKWTLITLPGAYLRQKKDVFIKPTTTKQVIKAFSLDLEYHPTPTWNFYRKYRTAINNMRRMVDPSIGPSNAAFTGFLSMAIE